MLRRCGSWRCRQGGWNEEASRRGRASKTTLERWPSGVLRRSVRIPVGLESIEDCLVGCLGAACVLFAGEDVVAVLVDDVAAASADPLLEASGPSAASGTPRKWQTQNHSWGLTLVRSVPSDLIREKRKRDSAHSRSPAPHRRACHAAFDRFMPFVDPINHAGHAGHAGHGRL
jgi:hypothetical protein